METTKILKTLVVLSILSGPILYWSCETAQEEALGLEENSASQVQFSTPPREVVGQTTRSAASGENALVVARRDPNTGEFRILSDKLSKELSDGTPVKYFAIRTTNADYGFIRVGQDADGNYRSEAFRSKKKNGKISVIVIEQAVWYTTCFAPDCSFCMPNSDGTACDCQLDDDIIIVGEHYEDIPGTDVGGTDTGCTFGGDVGSLFPTQVLY